MGKITDFLKGVFAPRDLTCSLCGRESFTGEILCERCLKKLERNDGYICDHCGAKTPFPQPYCDRCKNKLTSFDRARSAFVYGEISGGLLKKLKYDGKKYLAEEFAKELLEILTFSASGTEGLVYVPTTRKKTRKRGYNQSRLLAANLSSLCGVPLLDVLVKTKETDSQVGKSYSDRQKNLEGSFSVCDKSTVVGKKITLIDDVMTTGATAEAVAKRLKKAGAREVCVITVATTVKEQKENAVGDL